MRRSPIRAQMMAVVVLLCLLAVPAGCERQEGAPAAPVASPPVEAPTPADTERATVTGAQPVEWAQPRFDERSEERRRMVRTQIAGRRVEDEDVLAAMRHVPRHLFVPSGQWGAAYHDRPLRIGHGQTISQPYIVAYMTELLELEPGERVLEVGTGSGYQAAVLSEITPHVCTIEIIQELAEGARERLDRLGYDTVEVQHGDGYYGWEEHAPFDAVIVTAAAGHIPPPLVEQLKPGGRMVIPVGGVFEVQRLVLVTKDAQGSVRSKSVLAVRFVPMTGRVQEDQ